MCVCFGRVSLHCFNFCTPGIIYGPISNRCMGVASRWNYNGECMIKIFRGGGRDGDTFETPSLYEQLSPLPTPVLRCFWIDLLMNPHHPTSSIFHCYPSPSTTPSPPIKMFLWCLQYVSSICHVPVSISGPHRNCT